MERRTLWGYQPSSPDQETVSLGQVSDEPLTLSTQAPATVGAASAQLVAAGAGTGRTVAIKLPTNADTGIRVNFGAAVTTDYFLVEPGDRLVVTTEQAIHAQRAGAADVTVYVMIGVVS